MKPFASIIALALALVTTSLAIAGPADTTPSLGEITVTGYGVNFPLAKHRAVTPGAVSVINTAKLFHRKIDNLADMLRYTPGVYAVSKSGGNEAFYSIRGSNLDTIGYDGSGIKFLQNGLPITLADGSNHNRLVNPLSTRAIVIARGANALTYGASTLGGAINFVSPTGRDVAPLSFYLSAGSNGQQAARLTAGAARGDFDGLVTLDASHFSGYRAHSHERQYALYANAGLKLSDALKLRVFATYMHGDTELPGALTRAEVEADPDQANPDALRGNYQKNVEAARLAAKTT